jgi:hypothetical protein
VPSGSVVGSSTTSRPARTRALIVILRSVALDRLPNNRVEPTALSVCGTIPAFGRRGSPGSVRPQCVRRLLFVKTIRVRQKKSNDKSPRTWRLLRSRLQSTCDRAA